MTEEKLSVTSNLIALNGGLSLKSQLPIQTTDMSNQQDNSSSRIIISLVY